MKDHRIVGEGNMNRNAIDTFKKCGLLPSELLAKYKEAIEALEEIATACDTSNDGQLYIWKLATKAIEGTDL